MKPFSPLLAGAALALMTSVASAADIVDTAVSAGQFKTLVTALQEADLVDTLKGDGPLPPSSRQPTLHSPSCLPGRSTRC